MTGSEEINLWYKDAIIYQTHIRAFFDSDGDGIGDFCGLARKLDYIQDLGVTAVWILPFYPSPLSDDGYAIPHYPVHKRTHPDPEWAKRKVPWHYDHHMGPHQDANWCTAAPWFDEIMGTRRRYLGTERHRQDEERARRTAARQAEAAT